MHHLSIIYSLCIWSSRYFSIWKHKAASSIGLASDNRYLTCRQSSTKQRLNSKRRIMNGSWTQNERTPLCWSAQASELNWREWCTQMCLRRKRYRLNDNGAVILLFISTFARWYGLCAGKWLVMNCVVVTCDERFTCEKDTLYEVNLLS